MNLFLKTFIALVTALLTFFSAGGIEQLDSKGDISGYAQSVVAQKEIPDFYVDEDGDFTVLQFSDTHFTTCISWADLSIIERMKAQIAAHSPDLVVMTGDMINDGDKGIFNKKHVLDTVGNMFDSLNQYWAYVPGNNDGMNYGTASDVTAYLSQFKYCLVADEKDVSGAAQYSIDIKNSSGELTHSLVFLDTMDYDKKDKEHTYGYVHKDQVKWCKNEIASKKAENPKAKVSVFLHENTPNFAKAAVDGEAYRNGYATVTRMPENYNIPKNKPLDDVFEKSGCVGLVSMGHFHPLQCKCSFYNGTYYHITPQTKVMSALITIHTSEENVRDAYDFERVI